MEHQLREGGDYDKFKSNTDFQICLSCFELKAAISH